MQAAPQARPDPIVRRAVAGRLLSDGDPPPNRPRSGP